jgi:hypothetical protein
MTNSENVLTSCPCNKCEHEEAHRWYRYSLATWQSEEGVVAKEMGLMLPPVVVECAGFFRAKRRT